MEDVVLPVKELIVDPPEAFRKIKAAPSLAAMVIIYVGILSVNYFFSSQFFTFDSLKIIMPVLERLHLHPTHTTLFILSSILSFGMVLLGTALTHGTARMVGGTGQFKTLFTACLL